MPKIIEHRLTEEFKNREVFSSDELFDFFKQFEPDIKEGTFRWRICDLKKRNIIKPIRRGLYAISNKDKYEPDISNEILKIAKIITEKFKDIKHCIWETEWLNEFSRHQSGKRLILIEIEKEFVESLYYELKDAFRFDIYLNPDEKAIDFYVAESNMPVIIKKLITRSPLGSRTEKRVTFYIPLLEKILVDLYTEEKLFYFYQGAELMNIYENVIKSYKINYTKLLSYAKRRDRAQEVKQFMTKHMNHLVKNIIE